MAIVEDLLYAMIFLGINCSICVTFCGVCMFYHF